MFRIQQFSDRVNKEENPGALVFPSPFHNSSDGPVHATFDEHVVLLVGLDTEQVMINDPLDGTSNKAIDRNQFEASWSQLGKQAVSFT